MQQSLNRLIDALIELPGIGRKTAQRIALHLLRARDDDSAGLVRALTEARERLHPCPRCFSLTETELCDVCADPRRDHGLVCVVEETGDVLTLESAGRYRGAYHVLGGVLSPIDNVGPEDLRIAELVGRVEGNSTREVIIATNPTTEGEATAIYLARRLRPTGALVTRIARGLPVGSDLELADVETISRAFEGRRGLDLAAPGPNGQNPY
ncbi:MAG TPA: recombination protein RecR [candidate division WOR-3 bacterium]|uniref:Recombination protein RecR n=1 Tax=candidate division WOR-3 bacterium TaxID=2052148 RepID=A0A7V0T5W7_UNCW3|nr:recombination protein RecR [candidate division WOR-3 bacterium]